MTPFWAQSTDDVLQQVRGRQEGLTPGEALERLAGRHRPSATGQSAWKTFARQFLNPLVLMLVIASAISYGTGGTEDALIILVIVVLSGGVGFFQERAADRAVARLFAMVHSRATVRRNGQEAEVLVDTIVPGDIVILSVGATVPGDARVLSADGLQMDEAPLTGESFPVEKRTEPVPEDAPPGARVSAVFQGTHVVSGTAVVLIVATGADSELGRVGTHLQRKRPPTDFDLGLKNFGDLLATVSVFLVLVIFAVNVVLDRPALESLLFSVALAVGLVPELLPAIVSVNLARGAHRLAEAEVIVKRLSAIEDFGAIDVLCSDKTGTLTQGHIQLHAALGVDGAPSTRALELAWLNATFESGYANPIDEVLRKAHEGDPDGWRRVGEVPYDFTCQRIVSPARRGTSASPPNAYSAGTVQGWRTSVTVSALRGRP